MNQVYARNVQEALRAGINLVLTHGERRESRNGPVLGLPVPLVTTLSHPTERVLISKERNANPAFHLLEALWMLAGRNDVKFPGTIVKQIRKYSDTGTTLHGAYGHRWREWFGYDQLKAIAVELTENPTSRRCVLQMWDGERDLSMATAGGGKDVPCNTAIYFDRRNGALNMTVTNRSNDMIWGLYGANAVHMSVLQEYMAASIGCPVGWMTTISNDAHVYLDVYPIEKLQAIRNDVHDAMQVLHRYTPQPMLLEGETIEELDADIEEFFSLFDTGRGKSIPAVVFNTDWFNSTVRYMWGAWQERDNGSSYVWAGRIADPMWSLAMTQWLRMRASA
jgi:thymidylate synthase